MLMFISPSRGNGQLCPTAGQAPGQVRLTEKEAQLAPLRAQLAKAMARVVGELRNKRVTWLTWMLIYVLCMLIIVDLSVLIFFFGMNSPNHCSSNFWFSRPQLRDSIPVARFH